jgi:hypothetical protein
VPHVKSLTLTDQDLLHYNEVMMCKYGMLKQVIYLMSFFICAGVIASLTLVLKTLSLVGCFRHRNPISART